MGSHRRRLSHFQHPGAGMQGAVGLRRGALGVGDERVKEHKTGVGGGEASCFLVGRGGSHAVTLDLLAVDGQATAYTDLRYTCLRPEEYFPTTLGLPHSLEWGLGVRTAS
ncbi:hypothetical protein AAFF_G00263460 [Aldrovandia affinis]|uniref:Uncharacterized protein n=1 Tax=Aldrovandia affinis TaxID=143900 RepID=A0AAD7WT67_9TELE|nr:hypothetical protein AAFF_G00263460 [Aldrovandia affinis]